eukprot:TRINITY_DN58903_c0_g1_i1.p1 TRINITY_DN58903_c0_g1~~TRINITY_DN58903_c0_g1_i1.p1  ORF type:complete len:212 (-),score=25.31 TRINITY_DN58903_c0_g1_i1:408-968(-)
MKFTHLPGALGPPQTNVTVPKSRLSFLKFTPVMPAWRLFLKWPHNITFQPMLAAADELVHVRNKDKVAEWIEKGHEATDIAKEARFQFLQIWLATIPYRLYEAPQEFEDFKTELKATLSGKSEHSNEVLWFLFVIWFAFHLGVCLGRGNVWGYDDAPEIEPRYLTLNPKWRAMMAAQEEDPVWGFH